MDWNR